MAVGVREAARQCELPESTVQSWSQREGWFAGRKEVEAIQEQAIARVREAQGLRPIATKGAAEWLKEYDGDTRFSLAKGLNTGAKEVARMDGQEILMASQQISHLAKSASLVHGWQANSAGISIRMDIVSQCSEAGPVIDI